VELVPRRGDDTCNPDVEWLGKRLAAGGVDMVYLEPANNGWGGWPLELESVREVRRACTRHGALLILDATRVFANCVALAVPPGALVSAVQELTREAHGFTVSCGKELLVPIGGFAALPDLERQRRAYFQGLISGTLLESLEARSDLALGIEHITRHPEELVVRRELLVALAQQLTGLGVERLDPPGAHAVFVIVDPWVNDGLSARSLEAHLYRVGGVRAQISHYPLVGKHLLRLALPLRTYRAEAVARVALAVRAAIERLAEAPRLAAIPGEHVHDFFARYAPEQPRGSA
jgi:tryptophanase